MKKYYWWVAVALLIGVSIATYTVITTEPAEDVEVVEEVIEEEI